MGAIWQPALDRAGCVNRFWSSGMRSDVAELLRKYSHRNYQLRVLGVDKETMVSYLLSQFDLPEARLFYETQSSRLVGLIQLVPDLCLGEILGQNMWSIRHILATHGEQEGIFSRLMDSALKKLAGQADMISARLASGNVPAIEALQRLGFRVITGEISGVIRTDRPPTTLPPSIRIDPMEPKDMEEVIAIAQNTHIHNRFAYDRHFDRQGVALLYERQIQKYADDPDSTSLVARGPEGRIQGFICSRINRLFSQATGKKLASLDFIGVREDARTRGIGDALNQYALVYMRELGVVAVTVRTLMNNFQALGILRKLGMQITSSNVVLHRWWK